jgi:hypothetical protein
MSKSKAFLNDLFRIRRPIHLSSGLSSSTQPPHCDSAQSATSSSLPVPHADSSQRFEELARSPTTAFQSLVERSITAWDSLHYFGGDREFQLEYHSRILRRCSSIEDVLEGHLFWFFQLRESFMQQKHLMKWDSARLDEYILLPLQVGFANKKDCFFVSHFWHDPKDPDPKGGDIRLFQGDLTREEWSYIWLDWSCAPQLPRNKVQETYFTVILRSMPALIRDCGFEWRYPAFEPRGWILFEVAEYILNNKSHTVTPDIKPFISHVAQMINDGVRPVIAKHGYVCRNEGDLQLIIGWLELLVILCRVVPDVYRRRQIQDEIDKSSVGSCTYYEAGIEVDKAKGVVTHKGTTYHFTPVFRPRVE